MLFRSSICETARALESLAAFDIPVALTVVNKTGASAPSQESGDGAPPAGGGTSEPYPVRHVPLQSPEPIGVVALRRVAAYLLPGADAV